MIQQETIDMGTPASQPVIPNQPDLLAYGIQDLGLFNTYWRASYLAAFGVQAPEWDPTRVGKTWFDTSVDIGARQRGAVQDRRPGHQGSLGIAANGPAWRRRRPR